MPFTKAAGRRASGVGSVGSQQAGKLRHTLAAVLSRIWRVRTPKGVNGDQRKSLGMFPGAQGKVEADKASAIGSAVAAGGLTAGSLDFATFLPALLVPGLEAWFGSCRIALSWRLGLGDLLRNLGSREPLPGIQAP